MEKALQKMAHQLASLDEASLMALWDAYAERVARFEPSKRWEEAVLVLGMIQSVRFKNQLFNHHWSQDAARSSAGKVPGRPAPAPAAPAPAPTFELAPEDTPSAQPSGKSSAKPAGTAAGKSSGKSASRRSPSTSGHDAGDAPKGKLLPFPPRGQE